MELGAKGILTDYLLYQTAPFRTRESLPDAVQLLRLPNKVGKFDAWGCAVDHPTGQHLRALLHLGAVTNHADIQCRIFKGEGQNLLATIPGRDAATVRIITASNPIRRPLPAVYIHLPCRSA